LTIGGSDAGIAAGLRARGLDPGCEIRLALADEFSNYSDVHQHMQRDGPLLNLGDGGIPLLLIDTSSSTKCALPPALLISATNASPRS
jgi:hypothetical protein